VIGAWQWLPDYEIGVTTEISIAEAYRPLIILKRSFLGILSLIALTGLGCLILPSLLRRLGAQDGDAAQGVRRLGQYDLEERVARGGMGAVYRGKHRLLCREVAIKVLEGDEINPQSVSRFEREVKMTARLRHPNTIEIYDFGTTDNSTFFYVMEFVDGITLQELVDEFGPQPPSRVIHLLLQVCGSLSEAHQLGMIHRDVKPSNILLTAWAGLYDMIKVLDFGLVKQINRDTVELTQSDGITGTPMYMSPEAVRDAATATPQSDLYSVGAVGYALLTGLPTFEGDSSVDVCWKQLSEEPIRPCDRIGKPLPEDLQNVLMSCLRKEPRERPLSIDDLESALRQCTDAGCWSAADALRWWEVEFPASTETEIREHHHDKIRAGSESSRTTAP
jgi:serine/threonine-protein kinase